jgi:hypothetical protein
MEMLPEAQPIKGLPEVPTAVISIRRRKYVTDTNRTKELPTVLPRVPTVTTVTTV